MLSSTRLYQEIHEQPEKAFSDGDQSINFEEAKSLYKNVNLVLETRKRLV